MAFTLATSPDWRQSGGTGSLSNRIAHDLGVAIASGDYQPGDVLEGEVEVSERLQVSRTAYREAIRMLVAKGMVESRQRTGTRVLDRSNWHLLDPDVVAWSLEREPDGDFLKALLELRLIIEPEAAALAAVRRTPRSLSRLGHALEEMQQHDLVSEDGRKADQQFHRLVLEASGNAVLMTLVSTVETAINWVTKFKQRKDTVARDARPDHFEIFEAIAAGDAALAREAMVRHISRSQDEALLALNQSGR